MIVGSELVGTGRVGSVRVGNLGRNGLELDSRWDPRGGVEKNWGWEFSPTAFPLRAFFGILESQIFEFLGIFGLKKVIKIKTREISKKNKKIYYYNFL
ncbi:hypothetical protein [Mycoplasma sp. VS410B]|uniref:hypothetical protein n=1 Tax=Mycoplasma sp. VS410B TaxID=3401688 RepID=UPI003AB05105